jgi:integrase
MDIKVGNNGKPNAKRQARGHKCFWISTRDSKVAKLSGKGEVLWFHTLTEAQAKADELNAAQHTGGVVTRAEAGTLQATVDIYVTQIDERVADGSMVYKCSLNYKKAAADWCSWLGANTKACDITPDDIKVALKATGLAHKTKKEKLNTLRDVLEIARSQKWTANDNAAKAVKLIKATRKTEQEAIDGDIKQFDMDAIRDLITKAHKLDRGNTAWCDGLAASFALQTGLRFGEQAALRWSAIDFDKSRVRVYTAQRVIEFGNEIGQGKTEKSRRVVGLSRQLLQELRAWKLRSPFSADDDFVFPTRQGSSQRCSSNWRKRILHPMCDAVGIARLRWHDARHFYASVLLASIGRDWGRIADLMGHTSSDFTRKQYGHWIDTDEDDDADVVGDALWS